MDRRRAARALGGPRDRTVERPVDLEHARAVAESLGAAAGPRRQPVAGDRDELARRDVEQDGTRRRQVGERRRPDDRSRSPRRPPRARPRAPSRRRPRRRGPSASRPRGRTSPSTSPNEALNGRSRRSIEWAAIPANSARAASSVERVRGQPRAERSAGSPKRTSANGWRGTWTTGRRISAAELAGVADERAEHPPPGPPVRPAEPGRGRRQRPLEDRRPAAVERVGDRRVGMDHLHAAGGEVHRRKERRGERQGQDRRAHVVAEAGERQLGGPGPATGRAAAS